ncbi:sugar ABC transporter permease [Cetobacterium somerae]|uniref:carbohydrate ABC transporter permease n=1 Tax=Cetobacterium TaxID=180162 RepID=UPI00163C7993|nr:MULTISPECIES: sugar ABC transporter permease [Cetobacterium]MBC2852223.1 sugar ABC transporter permease [Cetobacterium sp. 2G large]MCQ9627331.1 sugar ABC transporter permease [Cetobacterium somerae]
MVIKIKQNKMFPYYLILPSFFIIISTVLYPIILTLFYSLEYYKLTKPYDRKFIGLQNYIDIFKGTEFYSAFINTSIIIIVILSLGIIFSFLVALILDKQNKFTSLLTAIAIIPWALPPVVNGLIWKFIFYPEFGFINKFLYYFNFVDTPILWLNSRYGSLIIFGIIVAWRAIPFCCILLLANIKAIPEEIFEAAEIDGASSFQKIKNIMLPILFPTFLIVITNLILIGINVFDEAISLVGFRKLGEPFMVYNYNQTFSFFNIGYGSAISYTITILCGVLGIIYIIFINKRWK